MKYLIASDLHGSEGCCRQLLAAFEREGADKLLLLGDILGQSPEDDAVAEMLNGLKDKILCAQGNCDIPPAREKLDFDMDICLRIPVVSGVLMFATHGHIYHSENRPGDMNEGDVLLQGHTHHNMLQKRAGFIYMNPGSVTAPRHDDERGYMTMEDGRFCWKRLDGTEYRRYEVKP